MTRTTLQSDHVLPLFTESLQTLIRSSLDSQFQLLSCLTPHLNLKDCLLLIILNKISGDSLFEELTESWPLPLSLNWL